LTDSITINGPRFTATIDPDVGLRGVGLHQAQTMGPADTVTSTWLWLPDIMRTIATEMLSAHRKLAEAKAAAPGTIQPIETAPRDGTRVDIWVRASQDSIPYRVADAAYSTHLRDDRGTSSTERYGGWYYNRNGAHAGSFLDNAEYHVVIGWSPIPKDFA
jgi:hypothetical protein